METSCVGKMRSEKNVDGYLQHLPYLYSFKYLLIIISTNDSQIQFHGAVCLVFPKRNISGKERVDSFSLTIYSIKRMSPKLNYTSVLH